MNYWKFPRRCSIVAPLTKNLVKFAWCFQRYYTWTKWHVLTILRTLCRGDLIKLVYSICHESVSHYMWQVSDLLSVFIMSHKWGFYFKVRSPVCEYSAQHIPDGNMVKEVPIVWFWILQCVCYNLCGFVSCNASFICRALRLCDQCACVRCSAWCACLWAC